MKYAITQYCNITETMILDKKRFNIISADNYTKLIDFVTDFCIDSNCAVRKALGMVATNSDTENNPDYVPVNYYQITASPWNSHIPYVEVELPNPAIENELYKRVRNAFIAEITMRLNVNLRSLP